MASSFPEVLEVLEKKLSSFTIAGGSDVTVEGSFDKGFAVNIRKPIEETVTATGACCIDGVCSITTQVLCEDAGGTYQGDDTTCSPDPCVATGACCIDDVCSITTENDCIVSGGTYQGDDTTCDPNPCICNCECTGGITITITATGLIQSDDATVVLLSMSGSQSHHFDTADLDPVTCRADYSFFECATGCCPTTDCDGWTETNRGIQTWEFSTTCSGSGVTGVGVAQFSCCQNPCDPDDGCGGGGTFVFTNCSIVDQPPGTYSDNCETHFTLDGNPYTASMDIEVTISCD